MNYKSKMLRTAVARAYQTFYCKNIQGNLNKSYSKILQESKVVFVCMSNVWKSSTICRVSITSNKTTPRHEKSCINPTIDIRGVQNTQNLCKD